MAVLSVLRQRRYATLSALMLLIATICVLLGAVQFRQATASGSYDADHQSLLRNQQINADQQATRLGGSVLNGYGNLLPGQTGTDGLVAIPPEEARAAKLADRYGKARP